MSAEPDPLQKWLMMMYEAGFPQDIESDDANAEVLKLKPRGTNNVQLAELQAAHKAALFINTNNPPTWEEFIEMMQDLNPKMVIVDQDGNPIEEIPDGRS